MQELCGTLMRGPCTWLRVGRATGSLPPHAPWGLVERSYQIETQSPKPEPTSPIARTRQMHLMGVQFFLAISM